jgi:hypothetical protein
MTKRKTSIIRFANGIAFFILLLLGCAATEHCKLDQRIDMGPYSFSVDSGTEESEKQGKRFDGGSWVQFPITELRIRFHVLRDDAKPFTTDFNRFFIDAMTLEDEAGNRFTVSPVPVSPIYSAGRYHSDSYIADVKLDPSIIGIRDSKHLGSHARDFRLLIENRDRQPGQPHRVSVQLQ